ncbi:TetR/AcrR family transcriptional regulator [Herbaspirillum sp. WKF16]|jgi:TetR/AcrR family transcriptional repressor of nem operon|uniref:TetR/AcrR family transcriptional regulator n=1 Tax=Herbaspirillum sp. WKF16 TaxID=3028312 RepID=UPI0023A958D3|nr:TetR/AcrR family transcriptional regulator [Herbaspirillum sp. WKF16]WDZ95242.1 TetR/AcrR family transcriptional regulator [Herbaspirillum sp. WKF16]
MVNTASTSSTADNILRCAQSLIVAGGYNGFSYADIAKVIGIRNASIHHHFPSKAELVRTLVARYREEAQAGIAGMERQVPQPLEQLRGYIAYWEACIGDPASSFCLCALLAIEMPVLPPEIALEVKAYFRTLSGWLTAVLERGASEGALQLSGPAQIEAEIFMAVVHGAMLSARAYGDAGMFGSIVNPLLARFARPA